MMILEPRGALARLLADSLADLGVEEIPEHVIDIGYRERAIILRTMQEDPDSRDVSNLTYDEWHEPEQRSGNGSG